MEVITPEQKWLQDYEEGKIEKTYSNIDRYLEITYSEEQNEN